MNDDRLPHLPQEDSSDKMSDRDKFFEGENRQFSGSKEKFQLQLGKIGLFLGSGAEKAGNIAGISIILFFALLVTCQIVALFKPGLGTEKMMTISSSIITLSLGYLFGNGKNK